MLFGVLTYSHIFCKIRQRCFRYNKMARIPKFPDDEFLVLIFPVYVKYYRVVWGICGRGAIVGVFEKKNSRGFFTMKE